MPPANPDSLSSAMTTQPADTAHRAFWTQRMEEAYAFMQAILAHPVRECGEPLVPLRTAIAVAGVEVAFSDAPFGGGFSRQFFLREGLLPSFLAAARDFNAQGLILKVEDGYRTRTMQKSLAVKPGLVEKLAARFAWECNGRMPEAALVTRRLGVLVALYPKTGTHMSASAIDMSVLKRDDGAELDRGAPYLEMSELTPMDSPFVAEACQHNRARITALMRKHGFMAYPYEFWHYCAGDAIATLVAESSEPARYGAVDWDPDACRVTPMENPTALLNTDAEIMARMEKALKSLAGA